MQDRVAILLSPARLACAALLVWVTASIAYVTQSSPAPKIDAATDALERCARDEICGAILATPACTTTVFCADVLDWIVSSRAVAVTPPLESLRTRTRKLNERYFLRELPEPHVRWTSHVTRDLAPYMLER